MTDPANPRTHIVEVIDLDSGGDRDHYSEIVTDKKVVVDANETFITGKGEKFIVLKYSREEEPVLMEEFKTPIIGF